MRLDAPVVGGFAQHLVQFASIATDTGNQRASELDQLWLAQPVTRERIGIGRIVTGIQIVLKKDLKVQLRGLVNVGA